MGSLCNRDTLEKWHKLAPLFMELATNEPYLIFGLMNLWNIEPYFIFGKTNLRNNKPPE